MNMFVRAPIVSYVVLAYLFTWGVSLPLLASRRGLLEAEVGEGWEVLAAFGPFLAAVIVTWANGGRTALATLWRGIGHWRVGTGWLAFTILSPFALLFLATILVRATTGAWPDLGALATGKLATFNGVLGLLIISGLVQGLGEEPGWRGFMLPRLRLRYAALTATLILFPIWLCWHLMAFLGRPEFGLPQWLGFSLGVLSAAVWLTFIWEHTTSTLMAIVWHTLINVARGIAMAISMQMFMAMSVLVLVGGLAIVVYWLVRGRNAPSGRPRPALP